MGTLESQIKLVKAILEAPEESVSKIADSAGVALQTAYSNLEEMYNVYMNKVLNEEEDIPTSMATTTFNGEVSPEEMIVVIEYLKKRNKKFNNKNETSNSNIDSMGSNNDVSGGGHEGNTFDIDTDIKALQLVLEKYKNKTVSADRVSKVIDIYRAMEFKYKKNPFALRGLLVQVLGAGPGEMAFQDFIDMIKFYLAPAELAKFGLISPTGAQATQQPFATQGGIDPMTMSMMMNGGGEGGDLNPLAMMAGVNQTGNQNWLQQILIADMFEERRRKRQRDEEESRQKVEDRRLAAKREAEEAESRRMMTMMMMSMANKNGNDSSIPPGYTVRRTYDGAGKPIDEYIPISQTVTGGQNGINSTNGAEMVKAFAEVIPKLMPQPQNNDFMQAMALKAIDKMNVQADPLESAARVMEVIDRFKPAAQPTINPYEKIEADIAMLDKKMAWWEKEKNWEAQQLDKRIAQENTKSYVDTIERVLSNVGAPLVEKFATGMAQRQPAPPMSMPGQPPQPTAATVASQPGAGMTEEEYFNSLSPEQLEEMARQRDLRLAEFQSKNIALENARRAKGLIGGQQQQEGNNPSSTSGGGGYYVNTGGSD